MLRMNQLPLEQKIRIIGWLTAGQSIRHVARELGIHQDTISMLSLKVGNACAKLHDQLMRNLQVNFIELDEQWDFVKKKQKNVKINDPAEYGDIWLYVALASIEKVVLSYKVGKRTAETTLSLALD